ncbi:hypothetical protein SLEP1_g10216 [Rubroshorea leprosula]|uniref:Uncharacterized protein n=1 Tax=Rubroshorea leprosula TaxID=152421 RepID=A0AAV5IGN0_9ROSI|nr:hypothetical protein SLEP1_g10216 [Rubroshorea leprosula]
MCWTQKISSCVTAESHQKAADLHIIIRQEYNGSTSSYQLHNNQHPISGTGTQVIAAAKPRNALKSQCPGMFVVYSSSSNENFKKRIVREMYVEYLKVHMRPASEPLMCK